MSRALSIALFLPAGVPAVDDIGFHVMADADALARRGHAVALFGPSDETTLVRRGRDAIAALRAGDAAPVMPQSGEVRTIALGRAVRVSGARRIGNPLETGRSLEAALSIGRFDVAHVHEPFAASPALGVVGRHRGVRAATFHEVHHLAGAALLQPLLARALAPLDLCVATTERTRRALAELVPRDYLLIGPAVARSPSPAPPASPPRLVLVARGRDHAARRFATALLARLGLPRERVVLVLSASPSARRLAGAARAAVAVDPTPAERAALFGGGVVVFVSPDDAASAAVAEAMAAGAPIILPRGEGRASEEAGGALVATAFSADSYAEQIGRLLGDAALRSRIGAAAAKAAGSHEAAGAAGALEAAYRAADAATASRRAVETLRDGGVVRNAPGKRR